LYCVKGLSWIRNEISSVQGALRVLRNSEKQTGNKFEAIFSGLKQIGKIFRQLLILLFCERCRVLRLETISLNAQLTSRSISLSLKGSVHGFWVRDEMTSGAADPALPRSSETQ
jgi:hypothetical protein